MTVRPYEPMRDRSRDEGGLTLVEMMVAILVIGVILTTLASVLVTTLRTIVHNERETAATALAQQEIERLQAAPWEQAGLLEDEVADPPPDWAARVTDGTFEGEELVLIAPPEGAEARPAQAPRLESDLADLEMDTFDFTVHRYVTWVDRTGNDVPETRRFTVIVSWSVLGIDRAITASGERSPTQSESEADEYGLRILNFWRSPDPASLDESGELLSGLTIEVRLNAGISSAELHHYSAEVVEILDADGLVVDEQIDYELRTLAMTGSVSPISGEHNAVWTLTLPQGSGPFVDGTMPLLFVGQTTYGTTITARGSVRLLGSDRSGNYPLPPGPGQVEDGDLSESVDDDAAEEDVTPGTDVQITSMDILDQACRDPSTWRMTAPVRLRIQTTGMTTQDVAEVTYGYRARANTGQGHLREVTESMGVIVGGTFEFTLQPAGDRYFANGDVLEFQVQVRREADEANDSGSVSRIFVNAGTPPC